MEYSFLFLKIIGFVQSFREYDAPWIQQHHFCLFLGFPIKHRIACDSSGSLVCRNVISQRCITYQWDQSFLHDHVPKLHDRQLSVMKKP